MTDPASENKPTPLVVLRRHAGVVAVVVLLCTVLAVAWAVQQPRTYGAEARVAVTGDGLSSEALGAFPLASQELAADYARYVNNAENQSLLGEQLGLDDGSLNDVSASPIPESNVVRIETSADNETSAVEAAQRIADALISGVNDTSGREAAIVVALEEYTALSQQVASAEQAYSAAQLAVDEASGRSSSGFPDAGDDIVSLRAGAAQAASELSILEVQQEALGERYRSLVTNVGTAANLEVVQGAASTGDDRSVQIQRFGLAGLVAGGLLGLGVALLLDRRTGAATVSTPPPAPVRRKGRELVKSGTGARGHEV